MQESSRGSVVRWTINSNQGQRLIEGAVEKVDAKEELTPVRALHFKGTVPETQENATRVTRGREPTPEKFLPYFQTLELQVREVLLDGFLKAQDVNTVISEQILD